MVDGRGVVDGARAHSPTQVYMTQPNSTQIPLNTTKIQYKQPDDVDGYGQAPLHLAALRGNLPVVEYLVLDAEAQTGRKVN